MNHRLPLALLFAPLLTVACGSGGSGSSGDTADGDAPGAATPLDTSAFAGLWDASETRGGLRDERYVAISADGGYTEYDFRQDGFADEGNCHAVVEGRLAPMAARDIEVGGNPLTDADGIVIEDVPTFRIDGSRTISLATTNGYPTPAYDASGIPVGPQGPIDFLLGRLDDGDSSRTFEWTPVTGQSETDLVRCTEG